MKNRAKIIYFLIGFVGLYILTQAFSIKFKKDLWKGFYYPEGDTFHPMYSGDFLTHNDCIDWAENVLNSRPQDREVSKGNLYECGKNCELTDTYKYLAENKPNYQFKDYPTYVCEETY